MSHLLSDRAVGSSSPDITKETAKPGRRHALLAAVVVSTCAATGSIAQGASVFVDARSNIFGYGVSTPNPGGLSGGIVAVTIDLMPGTGRSITFNNSGISGWTEDPSTSNGPDGGILNYGGFLTSSTDIFAVGPISGFAAPRGGHLVGLFLDADDPTGQSAPANFAYPDEAALELSAYSPLLRQVFFIGDGLTGTGTGSTQEFFVPDSATRLVLGVADALFFAGDTGHYGDNFGGFEVNYNVVPVPGAFAALGLAGLLTSRRRR